MLDKCFDKYFDLLITERDFSLNNGYEPNLAKNQQSIGQDVKHSIIESGLATELVAERSPTIRYDTFTKIILLVESDRRIVPGTVRVTEETFERLYLTADTYEFGKIGVTIDG